MGRGGRARPQGTTEADTALQEGISTPGTEGTKGRGPWGRRTLRRVAAARLIWVLGTAAAGGEEGAGLGCDGQINLAGPRLVLPCGGIGQQGAG